MPVLTIHPRLCLFHRLAVHSFCRAQVLLSATSKPTLAQLVLARHYEQEQRKLLRTDPADNIAAARRPRRCAMRREVATALLETYQTTKGLYPDTYFQEAIFILDPLL